MSFNYTSPFGIRLTATEEQLLESIDKFNCPLTGHANLADLHSSISVELSDKQKIRKYSYEITPSQRDAEINRLQNKIDEISELIDRKMQEFEETQGSERDKLGRKLGELEVERAHLSDIYYVYKNAKQGTNGNYFVGGCYEILGEYISSSKKVVLYKNSINSVNLLAIVYVHEMMHAYLDGGGITLPEIEEPIVEYGMLCFFKAFGDANLLDFAQKEVKNKQNTIGLVHYGFGHCIFNNPNGINWLDDYRNAKNGLAETDLNVAAYLDYWKTGVYPEKKEKECLEALYKALHHGFFQVMKVKNEQSKNKNDLIRELDDYLAKHSLIAVIPSDHKNRLYRGWKDSSARQYFDWLDPTRHPELIPLLNKHGRYGSIYNCVDLQQIAKIYKELVDKKTPEAQNAYGNNENMVSAIRHFIEHLLEINNILL